MFVNLLDGSFGLVQFYTKLWRRQVGSLVTWLGESVNLFWERLPVPPWLLLLTPPTQEARRSWFTEVSEMSLNYDKVIEQLLVASTPDYLMFRFVAVLLAKAHYARDNYCYSVDAERDDFMIDSMQRVCGITHRSLPTKILEDKISSVAELMAFVGCVAVLSASESSTRGREILREALFETIRFHAPQHSQLQRDCLCALGTFVHGFEAIALPLGDD